MGIDIKIKHESPIDLKIGNLQIHQGIRWSIPLIDSHSFLYSDGYDSFQNQAVNLLTHYLLQIIRNLAVEVKQILTLQGRTIPNSLHLLVVSDMRRYYDPQKLLEMIIKRKEGNFDTKSLDVIEKLGKKLFEPDIEAVNNYEKEKLNSNIRYIPPIYLMDLNKKALPYKHPVDEAFEMPPEITYQETKEKVVRQRKNIELLSAYTKRENRIALMGKLMEEEKQKNRRRNGQGEVEEDNQGQVPEKRQKFDNIDYL